MKAKNNMKDKLFQQLWFIKKKIATYPSKLIDIGFKS